MKDLNIDNLKLRASCGKLGNNSIGNYEWQSIYSSLNYSFAEVNNRSIETILIWQGQAGKVNYRISGNSAYNKNVVYTWTWGGDKCWIWPVPAAEMEKKPNLVQNEGWY
jgi:hypothetical protein